MTTTVESLYESYEPDLRRYAYAITRDKAAADDVLQETFITAYEHLQSGETLDKPKRWLSRIARNAAISLFQRGRRVTASDSIDDTPTLTAPDGLCPDVWAEKKQELAIVLRALEQTKPNYAEAFMRKRALGQSAREIGEAMGLSESAVANYVCFAWKDLQAALESDND